MSERVQETNQCQIKLLEDKGLRKLVALTNIPLENLSQKERLKATRVREIFKADSLKGSIVNEANFKGSPSKGLKTGDSSAKKISRTKSSRALSNVEAPQLQLIVVFSPIFKSPLQKITYCLIDRPKIPQGLNSRETKQRLIDLIEKLRTKMALPDSHRNLFARDCSKVNNICEVMEGAYTFFLSPMPNLDVLKTGDSTDGPDALWRVRFLTEVSVSNPGGKARSFIDRKQTGPS